MIARLRELNAQDDLRRWIALVVVSFGQLMIVLDATIVNVALPAIQRSLGFNQADLTWVVNAYAISYGGFVLLAGRLGDLLGRKRVFLAGVSLFTIASMACGLAPSPSVLVAARFAQGLGGALSAGQIIAIIVTGFTEPRARAQAMSVFAFTIAGGGSVGLLAGGLLTQAASWHWVFFINLPIGLATVLAGLRLIDDDRVPGVRRGVDVAGSVLVTAAVMLGVYAIVTAGAYGWTSVHTLAFAVTAALLLVVFLWLQGRLSNPIMPLRVLGIRSLMGASAARGLFASGLFTSFFLGALYLQQVRGYSALGTGLAFLPYTVAVGVLSMGITVRLVGRFGYGRVLVAGLTCVATALFLLSLAGPQTAYFPDLFLTYGLFGIGAGASLMPLTLLAMAEVPADDAGLASGITNASMQVSAAFGLAVLGTVATDHSHALVTGGAAIRSALAAGYQLAFTIAAASVAGAVLVVLLTLLSQRRSRGDGSTEREPEAEVRKAA